MRESSSGPVAVHPAVADADAVLFDFDFTLADSSAGIITCINYALAEMGLGEASTDDIIKTVGLYIPDALVVLKGEQHRHLGDEFMRLFTHKADDVMVDGTFFLPGAEHVLRTLSELGYRLAIVSTKYRFRIETVLERDGLRDTVEVIIGGEDVTDHKPHPEGLLKAVETTRAARGKLHILWRQRGRCARCAVGADAFHCRAHRHNAGRYFRLLSQCGDT